MNRFLPTLFLLVPVFCSGQIVSNAETPPEKTSVKKSDFIYRLPYEKGTCHLLVQGYKTQLSHRGEYALDFKMKRNTKICAARGGEVVAVKQDSHKSGIGKKYLSQGNHIIIRHEDGTFGNYWHLLFNGARVRVGDVVQTGEWIGCSGNTGFTAFPHLHFEVTLKMTPGQNQIPTLFQTRKGIYYLRSLRWYKSV